MNVKARFMYPNNGRVFDKDRAKTAGLICGKDYDVESINMGQSMTYIFLAGLDGAFNSVQFDFYEDGLPINIYSDKRFNPYL